MMCGRVFVRTVRPICPACHQEIEAQYKKVYDYLRKKENRQATIYEVSENTGVTVARIKEFIREGRLQLSQFPNMGYPCESCGAIIREGRLCEPCRKKFHGVAERLSQAFVESRERKSKKPQVYYEEKQKGYRHLREDDSES
jgi:flagellar operon protein (TIGR03826 family)